MDIKSNKLEKIKNSVKIQTIKEQVYDLIKERILDLSYEPGQRLIEKEIVNELGVSTSPIREAFHRLEQQGLVHIIPFKGCYVAGLNEENIKHVCQLREALELYCLQTALHSYSDEDVEELKRIMGAAQKHLKKRSATEIYDSHWTFHIRIVQKLRNNVVERLYLGIVDDIRRYVRYFQSFQPSMKLSNHEHMKILKAIEKKDADLAVREMKRHLSNVLDRYLKSGLEK
jgi:DNA-binding GntR family transcriptional regulator